LPMMLCLARLPNTAGKLPALPGVKEACATY
jgi:hypothetical protein